jgi:ketosteroid isomerase-like protein
MSNIDTVKRIYEAFGRGDVPAILEVISEDVEWEYGAPEAKIPWLEHGRGRAHVAKFFSTVAETLAFDRFDVGEIVGNDSLVVALVSLEARVKPTGKKLSEVDEVHIWRFDASGKVARFRHRADTLQHARAAGVA